MKSFWHFKPKQKNELHPSGIVCFSRCLHPDLDDLISCRRRVRSATFCFAAGCGAVCVNRRLQQTRLGSADTCDIFLLRIGCHICGAASCDPWRRAKSLLGRAAQHANSACSDAPASMMPPRPPPCRRQGKLKSVQWLLKSSAAHVGGELLLFPQQGHWGSNPLLLTVLLCIVQG